jgi:hypothetical protein
LNSLEGLENLTNVHGALLISSNGDLISLRSFSSLQSIGELRTGDPVSAGDVAWLRERVEITGIDAGVEP